MHKEVVSNKQAIAIMVLFLSGTSSASLFGIAAGKDVWLAILLAILAASITGIILARIHYIFPDKNLFEVLEICFGKFAGKFLVILFTGFMLQTAIDILTNMSFFIKVVNMPETPILVPRLAIMFLCLWVVKEGIEVLGRWTQLFIPFYVMAIFITAILLMPRMDLNNVMPFLYEGIGPVLRGVFYSFTFPFGEIVIFAAVFSNFKERRSSYKVYLISVALAGILVLIVSLTDILVLGVDLASELYYPTYAAVTKIDVGQFLQRMEILAALVMMLGGFVKISIYLLAACKGIAVIFEKEDYRFFTTPVVLLIISLSAFFHRSVFEFTEWNNETWPYIALLFQVIIPVIVLGACEIKRVSMGVKNKR